MKRKTEQVRKIKINNFRSLDMEDFIEIKRFTLLFGKNGSGKSSFIKSIMFTGINIFQDNQGETIYELKEMIDLGDFSDIVNKNDKREKITIEYQESDKTENVDFSIKTTFQYKKDRKNLYNVLINDKTEDFQINIFPFIENKTDKELIKKITPDEAATAVVPTKCVFETDNSNNISLKEGFSGFPNRSISYHREFNLPTHFNVQEIKDYLLYSDYLPIFDSGTDKKLSYYNQLAEYFNLKEINNTFLKYWSKAIIRDLTTRTKSFFDPLYVGPFRERPQSEYKLFNNRFNGSEYSGGLKRLDDFITDYNPYYPGNELENFMDFINHAIKDMGLGKSIEIVKLKNKGKIIFTDKYDNKSNLCESSSGLQHILPLIIYCSLMPYRYVDELMGVGKDIMIIEQPELHLHPALQGEIMNFISKSSSGTYLIETHSEHMVRKLQVLIAKGELNKEDIAIYYFDKDKETGLTKIKEMKLEDNGFFKEPWPDGFFDDSYNLTKELLRANKN